MQSSRPKRLAKPCAMALLLILPSCAGTMGSAVTKADATRVACQSFQPLRWSSKDTDYTILQAKEHNAAGAALGCWKTK